MVASFYSLQRKVDLKSLHPVSNPSFTSRIRIAPYFLPSAVAISAVFSPSLNRSLKSASSVSLHGR